MDNQSNKVDFNDLCQRLFKTVDGQLFLNEMGKRYLHRRSFTINDPYTTAFKEGQRDTAMMLIELGRKQ